MLIIALFAVIPLAVWIGWPLPRYVRAKLKEQRENRERHVQD